MGDIFFLLFTSYLVDSVNAEKPLLSPNRKHTLSVKYNLLLDQSRTNSNHEEVALYLEHLPAGRIKKEAYFPIYKH
jgi:hypothetical protein